MEFQRVVQFQPSLADVCMNCILKEVSTFKPQPRVLFRYVDDLFYVFHGKDELEQFSVKIISVHVNIQFTKELEQRNQLPYLDVLVSKSVDKFKTTVFRKKTNTNLYMKWSSLCPSKFKRNLLKCLLDRACCISSSYKAMSLEFNSITDMLLKNGYPLHFV